ncbi:MAG: CoA-binding protein [Capsulimonadaceae bacterium]|nr:CoA-binding protein [Capsulimonadaceae bacterium]
MAGLLDSTIDSILQARVVAVVGASRNPEKYGSIAYAALKAAGKRVLAVNPSAADVDGDPCYPSLTSLPVAPDAAVFVVPPSATEAGMTECAKLGIRNVWVQPGAEPDGIGELADRLGLEAVFGGPCIMVALKTRPFAARGLASDEERA